MQKIPNPISAVLSLLQVCTAVLEGVLALLRMLLALSALWVTWRALRSLRVPGIDTTNATTLLFNPVGRVVEKRVASQSLLGDALQPVVELAELEAALRMADADPQIKTILFELDDLDISLFKARQLAQTVKAIKERNVTSLECWTSGMVTEAYTIASHARIALDGDSALGIEAYGPIYKRTYLTEAFENLGIDIKVYVSGAEKTAPHIFQKTSMTATEKYRWREATEPLWQSTKADIEEARGLPSGTIQEFSDGFIEVFANGTSKASQYCLEAGLVDELMSKKAFDKRHDPKSRIPLATYMRTRTAQEQKGPVRLVYVQGTIDAGTSSNSTAGAATVVAELLRHAQDPHTESIVLRLDTPGGSLAATKEIEEACHSARVEYGKKVIGSCAELTASGGMWLTTCCDLVYADPHGILGSIGVFAVLPNQEGTKNNYGFNDDGAAHTVAGAYYAGDDDADVNDSQDAAILKFIELSQNDFIDRIAAASDRPKEEIDAIADGRIFSAEEAAARGLVHDIKELPSVLSELLAEYEGPLDEALVRTTTHLAPLQRLRTLLTRPLSQRWRTSALNLRAYVKGSLFLNYISSTLLRLQKRSVFLRCSRQLQVFVLADPVLGRGGRAQP